MSLPEQGKQARLARLNGAVPALVMDGSLVLRSGQACVARVAGLPTECLQASTYQRGILARTLRAAQPGQPTAILVFSPAMQLTITVSGHVRTVDLPGVSQAAYNATQALLTNRLGGNGVKNREAIIDAFLYLLGHCPDANVSDLWHHIVYRLYSSILVQRGFMASGQSWVRASGEALELVLQRWYQPDLAPHGIEIKALLSRSAKQVALAQMGLSATVGASKLDIALSLRTPDGGLQVFGGVHVKASLAERVSDDVPASLEMMRTGHFSPLWTLDVKSFPPPHGDLVNRGELGAPSKPSEKRKYVELHGSFDNCYSANSRTQPTVGSPPSAKRIYTLNMWQRPDQFARDVIAQAEQRRAAELPNR